MKTKAMVMIAIVSLLSGLLGIVMAHTEGAPFLQDMIADGGDESTAIDVGNVSVWNDGTNLYVEYSTIENWKLLKTHLHVDPCLIEIPQTKNGNPKVGKFFKKTEHDPPVDNYLYTIPLSEFDPCAPGTTFYIAAQADVNGLISMDVVSGDGQTMVTRRRAGNGAFTTASLPAPAVRAKEPFDYPNQLLDGNNDGTASVWDDAVGLSFTSADWIWETDEVQEPVEGTVITLQRDFEIDGYPTSGELVITCDNGYKAFVNGPSVGTAPQVLGDLEICDLREACILTSGWDTVQVIDVSSDIQSGENTLTVDAANEEFSLASGEHSADGTVFSNPGGCIFELEIDYIREETAWGGTWNYSTHELDEQFTTGKSWAAYFTYVVQEED